MFYLRYLRAELVRRAGRTLLTALALAVGVCLVIDVAAIGGALDNGQNRVLDPLAGIGSDLLVTRASHSSGGAPSAELGSQMQSVVTDLSKLGNPGDHFVHDFFLPNGELTFPPGAAQSIAALPGVASVGSGLTVQVMHEEGTVPKILATFQQAARTFTVDQSIQPLTPAEESQVQACVQQAQKSGQLDDATLTNCLPARFRSNQLTFTIPAQTIQQIVNPPATDIKTSSFTLAGVDLSQPGIGIVTAGQVTSGRFLEAGRHDALLAEGYAERRRAAVGDPLDINGTVFSVAGVVKPPLSGQAADVYVSLDELQKLSQRDDLVNVILVRAGSASGIARVAAEIEAEFPDAQVTASTALAARVSGSLVDARNLVDRAGRWLAGLVLVASSSAACLLMLAAVGRRVRELGTLRALGWSAPLIVRQVLGESLAVGALGGVLGAAGAVASLQLIGRVLPPLQAIAPASDAATGMFGMGAAAQPITETIRLQLSADPTTGGIAVVLAVVCGLIAGGVAAARAARLRPLEALRELG